MSELKFIADGMLGKLTRWLRILGQDVEYAGSMDDSKLVYRAAKENRILLTRDVELYRHAIAKGIDAFLIENSDQTADLPNLARRFKINLEVDVRLSRCPKCNSKIKPVSKKSVVDRIPSTTSSRYSEFWQCQGCSQIYWHGTHWKRIDKALEEARKGSVA
jgi:uncharacterized protein with PIN domain